MSCFGATIFPEGGLQDKEGPIRVMSALHCASCLQGAFIQTIEALSKLGYIVMVSNQGRYFRLASYLASFTRKSIVIAMGIPALKVRPVPTTICFLGSRGKTTPLDCHFHVAVEALPS